jgi:hypothetical protein
MALEYNDSRGGSYTLAMTFVFFIPGSVLAVNAVRSHGKTMGCRKCSTHRTTNYADFRTALSTRVLPSDQIAPGTL